MFEWMRSNATGNKAAANKLNQHFLHRKNDALPDRGGDAKVQKQSYQEPNLKSMIQTASLSGMNDNVARLGSLIQYASLGGNMGSALGSFGGSSGSGGGGGSAASFSGSGALLSGSTPGSALGNVGIGRRGIIGGGASGSSTSIPDSVPMTAAERNTLGLIMKYESGGQNRMNYVGKGQGLDPTTAKGYTAQGYFQMLNSNWRRIAPKLGINTPNAMASSLEDQTKVALHLLRNGGVGNWASFNPRLKAALSRGEIAPNGMVPNLGGGGGGDGGGGVGQYAGLRVKGAQAIGGGGAHVGITDLARAVQGDLPGGVKHFAAFNDRYHAGTGSKHASGLAFDTSLIDPRQSAAAANSIREKLMAAGLQAKDFKVIDEYLNPSARATGGHIHTQLNSAEAAAKYRQYAERLKKSTVVAAKAAVDPDRFKSFEKVEGVQREVSGDKPVGLNQTNADGAPKRRSSIFSMGYRARIYGEENSVSKSYEALGLDKRGYAPPPARLNPEDATRNVPLEPSRTDPSLGRRSEAGGGGTGGGGSPQVVINGFNGDPEALANAVQRRLSERMGRRTHEVEHHWG